MNIKDKVASAKSSMMLDLPQPINNIINNISYYDLYYELITVVIMVISGIWLMFVERIEGSNGVCTQCAQWRWKIRAVV